MSNPFGVKSETTCERRMRRFARIRLMTPLTTCPDLDRLRALLDVIGRGGMGVVLKAFDTLLHRVVAVKVLSPQLATTASARKRFERESRAAAAVSHEHVVAIYEVGEANGLPYLVMEYVAGPS